MRAGWAQTKFTPPLQHESFTGIWKIHNAFNKSPMLPSSPKFTCNTVTDSLPRWPVKTKALLTTTALTDLWTPDSPASVLGSTRGSSRLLVQHQNVSHISRRALLREAKERKPLRISEFDLILIISTSCLSRTNMHFLRQYVSLDRCESLTELCWGVNQQSLVHLKTLASKLWCVSFNKCTYFATWRISEIQVKLSQESVPEGNKTLKVDVEPIKPCLKPQSHAPMGTLFFGLSRLFEGHREMWLHLKVSAGVSSRSFEACVV